MNLFADPYVGYAYAYPHKTSYRHMEPLQLRDVWAEQKRDALFLYFHIPFCSQRCGYCNLLSISNPDTSLVANYVHALKRQVETIKENLNSFCIDQMAIGGGTPTFLSTEELSLLFDYAKTLGVNLSTVGMSIELSPETVAADKIDLLKENAVNRVSIGIQSFFETELQMLNRRAKKKNLVNALKKLQAASFDIFNIDLIYGIPGQTPKSFLQSITQATDLGANEVYLYPLYIRKMTELEKAGIEAADTRLRLYRFGRDFLLKAGFRQLSMRHFSKVTPCENQTEYACQLDGMVGIGCGARSYTDDLHYSFEYAIQSDSVSSLIKSYISADFSKVNFGIKLNPDDRRRRYILKSLMQVTGVDLQEYKFLFKTSLFEDYEFLQILCDHGLAKQTQQTLKLTSSGLERSDAISPWLYSSHIKSLMKKFLWR